MILVTGGTGFIGSRLVKKLIEQGYETACVYRDTTDFTRVSNIYDQVVWVGNSESAIVELFKDNNVEGIIHCATAYGRNNDVFSVMESNVEFPFMLLKKASKYNVKFFVNTDSFFSRELDDMWKKKQKVYMDSYTKTKFIFREYVRDNMEFINVAFINMELQHVYGENDSSGKFIQFLLSNFKNNVEKIELTEGSQRRDWIYVEDVINAYITILEHCCKFQPHHFYEFEVGTGKETSLKEFCLKMKKQSGAITQLEFGKKPLDAKQLDHSVANTKELFKLGWRPQVSVDEGIRRILENADCFNCNTNL